MRRRLVDRERVVGERRAVVRRGRKHTREHFQKEEVVWRNILMLSHNLGFYVKP